MRIFISCRRADLEDCAELLVKPIEDRFESRFGRSSLFLDVHSIRPGQSFDERIQARLVQADAVLVIVGPDWLREMSDRSASGAEDSVRAEIEFALRRKLRVVPILVQPTDMPGEGELPDGLKELSRKNAISVDTGRDLPAQIERIVESLGNVARSVGRAGPFEAFRSSEDDGSTLRFTMKKDDRQLTYKEVLALWQRDEEFRSFYLRLLTDSPFSAFVWESPPIAPSRDRPFEFVLRETPTPRGSPDRDTFQEYFGADDGNEGVVAFPNLGGDSLLVVPTPIDDAVDYSDLATFLREAPPAQHHALWRVVGERAEQWLSTTGPVWISVAGGGVSWLHVRLDPRPKYYRYTPYRSHPDR